MYQKIAILMTIYRDVSADEMIRAIYVVMRGKQSTVSFQHICWRLIVFAKKEVKPFHQALQKVVA